MRTRSAFCGLKVRVCPVVLRLGLLLTLLLLLPSLRADVVKIGVLAFRPKAQTLEQWRPLAKALNQALPDREFSVEAFTYTELDEAITARQLDFVLTNSGHFVLLKHRAKLSAPLVTLVLSEGGRPTTQFGGVIFGRAGQTPALGLRDLKGRRLAFISTESLGGYQMQAFELSRAGIHLPEDATLIATGVPHDNVVEAVLAGRADAGFVRSGVLESLAREGRLDLSQIQVIHPQEAPDFAAQVSTRLYPEWPVAALSGTDKNLARQVASALLRIEENKAAVTAMGIHGFGVSADYSPVEEVLRELRMPPFDTVPSFTAKDVLARYRWQVLTGLAAAGLIAALWLRLLLLNRRLASGKRSSLKEHRKLRASEAENRALISAIPDLIFTNDRSGTFHAVHVSDPALLLMPPETFLNRKVTEVLPAPLGETFLEAYHKALDSGSVQELHYSLPLNGEEMHFEARVVASAEDRVMTIVRDVSMQRRAERALVASQELFFKAFATSPEAININRLEDGVYLAVNEGFTRITGFTAEEVVGRASTAPECRIWLNSDDRERMAAVLKAKGELQGFEAPFRAKDGRLIAGLMSASIVEIDGKLCIVSVTQDITSRKSAEEEKAKLQAQLDQAHKLESVGRLAGGIAHDMNNVLGAILGLATVHIETTPPGSPIHRAFDTISKAATRGSKVVKSLLSIARQSPAEERELDVNELLKEQVYLLERTTLSKVQLELDLASDLAPILGDASALTHAFMNLCVNAVDAMPEKGRLTLRTRNLDQDWVEVEVGDTGSGMSKEVLAKALDPFFTTKEVGKGTGLGLSMVYSTVKAHRGQLDIQSECGLGTLVRMRFPATQPGPQRSEPSAAAGRLLAPSAMSVLLVDDDDLVQSSSRALLEVLGHEVVSALCGEEALARLEAGYRPDAVILDMNMPGLGGAGTLPRLRQLQPFLPVFLATGRVDQSALALVAAHPCVTLLSKPFDLSELRKHLQALASV